jgi:hypothetical protein
MPSNDRTSSRELAQATKADHFHVLRDLRALLKQHKLDPAQFSGSYLGGNGEKRPEMNVPVEIAHEYLRSHANDMARRVGAAIDAMCTRDDDPDNVKIG